MQRRGWALLFAITLIGCTRVVDTPQPQAGSPVAPIAAGQAHDLLSPDVQESDGNLFVTAEPEECAGVAREVDPPFIFDNHPAAHDGGHWVDDKGLGTVQIEEIVGVYPADFDPKQAIADAKRSIESCRGREFSITTMQGDEDTYSLVPQVDSGSPDIVIWSFKASDWACDNAFVAAHNAAVEITTCSSSNGYDVLALAQDALKRIETLANTTA